MRATLRERPQPNDSRDTVARSSMSRARSGPSSVRRSRMCARKSASLSHHCAIRVRQPFGRPHQVAMDRQVLREHEAGLVRPVLEQVALAVGDLLEQRLVERAVAGEEHQQVVAGDDRGRVQLQAAQGARRLEQVLRGRLGPGQRAREPLVADREPSDRGGCRSQHRRDVTNGVGRDRPRRCGRSTMPAAHQASARIQSLPTGVSSISARSVSAIGVTGWFSATQARPSGIVSGDHERAGDVRREGGHERDRVGGLDALDQQPEAGGDPGDRDHHARAGCPPPPASSAARWWAGSRPAARRRARAARRRRCGRRSPPRAR